MTSTQAQPHPVRRFRDALADLGAQHIPHPRARALFAVLIRAWRRWFRLDVHEQYIFQEFAAGRDGFRPRYWIFRSFFYPDYVATFVLAPTGTTDPARTAAQVLHGALTFRDAFRRGALPPEFEKGQLLDPALYGKLFSRVAVARHRGRRLVQEDADFAPTDYVVVFVRGHLYRLACLQDGAVLPCAELHRRLAVVLEHARARAARTTETPGLFGLLTVSVDPAHGRLLREFTASNAELLETVNAALFTLALDLEARPENPDAALRAINADHFANRDHRRSMSLVVTGNGRAGVLVNPHTGVGGAVSAVFADFLHRHAQTLQAQGEPAAPPADAPTPPVAPLPLSVSPRWTSALLRTRPAVERRLYPPDEQTVFTLDGVGLQDFRACRISADAAFHCALNLAYLRCLRRMPTTGNFISLRSFRHGDIWRYVSNTEALTAFLRQPGPATLRAAVAAHNQLVKHQKKAEDAFYHVAMMLLKLVGEFRVPFAAALSLIAILSLFIRDFSHRFLRLDLWASQIPVKPGLEIAGRGSVFLSFLPREALAGHYLIFEDHFRVCFLRGLRSRGDARLGAAFARELGVCLREVRDLAQAEE